MRVRRFGSCSARWAMSQRRSFDSRPATPISRGGAGAGTTERRRAARDRYPRARTRPDGGRSRSGRRQTKVAVSLNSPIGRYARRARTRARGRPARPTRPRATRSPRVVGRVHGALADPVEELVGVPSPTLRHRRAGPRVGHRHSGRHVHVVSGQRHRGRRVVARRSAATRGFARAVASRRAARPPSRERHDDETRWSRTRPRRDTPSAPRNGASGAPTEELSPRNSRSRTGRARKTRDRSADPRQTVNNTRPPRDGPTLRRTRPGDVVHDEETPWVTPSSTTRATSTSGVVRPRGEGARRSSAPRVPAAPHHLFFPRARARPRGRYPVQTVTSPAPSPAPLCPRPRVPSSSRTNPTTRRSPSRRTVTRPWTAPAARSAPRPPRPRARSARSTPDRFAAGSHTRSIPPRETRLPRPDPRPRETRLLRPDPRPRSPDLTPRHSQNSLSQTRRGGDRIRRARRCRRRRGRRRRRVVDGGFEVERRVLRVRSRRTTPRARGNPRARTTPRRTRIST